MQMFPNHFPLRPLVSAAALTLCSFGLAQAQTAPAPNAGQILRELQVPAPLAPAAVPAQRAEPAAETGTSNQAKIRVMSIVFTGNQEITTSDLLPLVSSLVGSEQTLGQLNAAARRITAYYRSRGFAVA